MWGQACIAQQIFLDPLQNGYHRNFDGELTPTTTDILPAPKAVIEMVRCQCKGDCTSQRCSCKSNSLQCTDLCLCSTQCENDEESYFVIVIVMTSNSQIVKNWYKIFIHINSTMHLLFYLNLIFYFCLWHSMNDCIDFYKFETLTRND